MAQNTPADWQGDYVSFHRNNRSRDFTVMGNIHLRDKNLSLKAVGLLSKMLSFNDSWQFSTRGLAAICKEGPDAILSTLKELEESTATLSVTDQEMIRADLSQQSLTYTSLHKPVCHTGETHTGKIPMRIIQTWIIHVGISPHK